MNVHASVDIQPRKYNIMDEKSSEKTPPKIIRLSISEAARLFGIEQKTIRRAISNAEVKYVVVRGRYKVNMESLLRWSQSKPRVQAKLEENGIGQFVSKWKIKNTHYSPNPDSIPTDKK